MSERDGSKVATLLDALRLPEPQRTWVVEILSDLVRQRDECKDRNLVRLQTDMGPCDFIPKVQADEEIEALQARVVEKDDAIQGIAGLADQRADTIETLQSTNAELREKLEQRKKWLQIETFDRQDSDTKRRALEAELATLRAGADVVERAGRAMELSRGMICYDEGLRAFVAFRGKTAVGNECDFPGAIHALASSGGEGVGS